jgi:hypothetical protein
MQIELTPQTQAKLENLAPDTGRNADEMVEHAWVGYLHEVAPLREGSTAGTTT